ncbi:MAG: transposase [Candidatus Aminicenantes bacterium]|nr:transposase [Candidatus Aminicenantes bacterium]
MKEKIKELSLLLLYLSGWEEDSRNTPGEKLFRAWNGYLFKILNQLEEEELIHQFSQGKSVIITREGLNKAKELEKKYL